MIAPGVGDRMQATSRMLAHQGIYRSILTCTCLVTVRKSFGSLSSWLQYFADAVSGKLTAMNLGWPSVFALLNVAYFGLHYMFASQTAHGGGPVHCFPGHDARCW